MAPHDHASASNEAENNYVDIDARLYEDLAAAVIFIAIGLAAFISALGYPSGTAHRVGPALFPMLISGLLTVIGMSLAIRSFAAVRLGVAMQAWKRLTPQFSTVRALFFVMLSLLAFALLIRPAGLMIATIALIFIATRAEPGRRVLGSLVLAVLSACIAASIFVYGIGLPIPLWP
jgi:hypothetical protein